MHVTTKEVESELLFGFRCEYNIWAFPQDLRGPGWSRLGFLSTHAHLVPAEHEVKSNRNTIFSREAHTIYYTTVRNQAAHSVYSFNIHFMSLMIESKPEPLVTHKTGIIIQLRYA